jgi:glycosyltransferase involved in cell wall biosynthesis
MKVALVHDYLTQRGGAERVFELLCKRFPEADIFTSLYDPEGTIDLRDRIVNTTVLQSIPGASRHFRIFAPLYFPAFRQLDLNAYDLVLSSTTSFAKAVRTRPDTPHICFCHNITRFLWDTQTYLRGYKEFQMLSPLIEPIFHQMRRLDLHYAQEPNIFVANSSTVAERIRQIYNRPASYINYPIDGKNFKFSDKKQDYCLVSCRLLSYKRVDIIVEAFNWLGWPLIVMGDGPEQERLEALAMDNITFIGHVSDEERTRRFAEARLIIVAGLEDYGLVPIEANFSGTPVIAYGAGGVLDTQIPGVTGLFFNRQTPDAVQAALVESQNYRWDYHRIHRHAIENFTEEAFFRKLNAFLNHILSESMTAHLGLNQPQSKPVQNPARAPG